MEHPIIDTHGVARSVVSDYCGLWSMKPDVFQSVSQLISHMDVAAAVGKQPYRRTSYDLDGATAVISIVGTMTKGGSCLWGGGASTIDLRSQVRQAAANDAVKAIVLHIDSPGGMVAGTKELADDVAGAAKKKPVFAYIEDLGASAAYWVASQCQQVFCNQTAMVGSIGTYGVVYDYSAAFEKEGVKALVFSTGPYKGAGVPGTEITKDQQAEYQRLIYETNAHFLQDVSAGRKMPMNQLQKIADGRVHIGQSAVNMGLVDGVKSFDQVLDIASTAAGEAPTKGMTRAVATTPAVSSAIKRWDLAIAKKMDAGMNHGAAMRAVVREQPELHRDYLREYNESKSNH